MIIGITGGIGTGKSTILKILREKYGFVIFEADKIGHERMAKGQEAYAKIIDLFGNEILDENLEINRKSLSNLVFHDKEKLEQLNQIIHPAVIKTIQERIHHYQTTQNIHRFVIEAALLIESGCDQICDTVWYIYADEDVRIERLMKNRNMTKEQIASIMKNQLKKQDFEENTDCVIDNSGSIKNTEKQIEKLLEISSDIC